MHNQRITKDFSRLHIAIRCANDAGRLIAQMRGRQPLREKDKGGTNFSTAADDAAEKLILSLLKKAFPSDLILAEESAGAAWDESAYRQAPSLWVIDPLDGSTVYNRGFENYAVSIGYLSDGVPQLGVVALPAMPLESGKIFFGAKGSPAGQLNPGRWTSKRIDVPPPRPDHHCVIGMSFGYTQADKEQTLECLTRLNEGNFRTFLARGSAVEGLIGVATGRVDAYFEPVIKPWDTAAAGIIVQCAGGIVTRLDGSPWDPFCPDILATNGPVLHDHLVELLNKKTERK